LLGSPDRPRRYPPEVLELVDREIEDAQALADAAAEPEPETELEPEPEQAAAPEMTEEECKALFAMLDEECDGVLNRINFLDMGEAIGFEFAEHHLDMAMAEIVEYPTEDQAEDEDPGVVAATLERERLAEVERAKLLVYDEADAWILLKSKDLQSEEVLVGKVVRIFRLGAYAEEVREDETRAEAPGRSAGGGVLGEVADRLHGEMAGGARGHQGCREEKTEAQLREAVPCARAGGGAERGRRE
jgi:hypothetical protein